MDNIETKTNNKNGIDYNDPKLAHDFLEIQNNVFQMIKDLTQSGNYYDYGWDTQSHDKLLQKIIEADKFKNSKQIRKMVIDYFHKIGLKDEKGDKREMTAQEQDKIIKDVFIYLNNKIKKCET